MHSVSIPTREVAAQAAGENRFSLTLRTDRCPQVTSAIGAARKVCGYVFVFKETLVFLPWFMIQGHWIQDCPTNNDRDYDNRPRIKRTTGIPRSFLKAVDNPSTSQLGHGVMVTPEGGYVVAQPDS